MHGYIHFYVLLEDLFEPPKPFRFHGFHFLRKGLPIDEMTPEHTVDQNQFHLSMEIKDINLLGERGFTKNIDKKFQKLVKQIPYSQIIGTHLCICYQVQISDPRECMLHPEDLVTIANMGAQLAIRPEFDWHICLDEDSNQMICRAEEVIGPYTED